MSSTLPLIVVIAAGIVTIIGAGAALVKIIIPLSKGITDFREKIVPNVDYMPLLADISPMIATLRSIEAEFTGDSGATIKDAMDRLEQHATQAEAAAANSLRAATEFARVNRESITQLQAAMLSVRELAAGDRKLATELRDEVLGAVRSLARVEASGLRMEASGERVEASGARTEASGARTEASGARTEAADEVVAHDLAARERRADEVSGELPGAAADAAFQSAEAPDNKP